MSENGTIDSRVVDAVAKVFHRDSSDISLDTRYVEDLMSKSLNVIELTAVLESEFDVDIPGADARRCRTVGDSVSLIRQIVSD
jgi:acyl carrier protein